MRVLSLYDGISCGMVALLRAGFTVDSYDAYEIDKYAVKISEKNFPEIKHHGNVFDGDFTQFKGYDLLIGGSPCTYWSIAKTGRETTPDGIGGQLFMEYVRALRESGCKYFLYENNYSIHKNIKAFISEQLGVEPIMINSALVSAQQRKRCYWTNIPNVTQPEDRGILLKDVLESGTVWQDKSYCVVSSYRPTFYDSMAKRRNSLVAEPVAVNDDNGKARTIKAQYGSNSLANAVRTDGFGATMVAEPICEPRCVNSQSEQGKDRKQPSVASRIYDIDGKNPALTTCFHNNIAVPVGVAQRGRYIESGGRSQKCEGGTEQFFEARKDSKSNCLTTVQKDSMVAIPINTYNNEGEKSRTVMAGYYKYGEATLIKNEGFKGGATAVATPIRLGTYGGGSQGQRIYSVHGKSVTLCSGAGGMGSKTGLYKIDLPDGDYLIRKLTPVESERLQTLPDNYTEGISKTQRYKCIGNGWTVDVIAHIMSNLKGEVD